MYFGKFTILAAIGFLEKLLRDGKLTAEQRDLVQQAQRLLIRADD